MTRSMPPVPVDTLVIMHPADPSQEVSLYSSLIGILSVHLDSTGEDVQLIVRADKVVKVEELSQMVGRDISVHGAGPDGHTLFRKVMTLQAISEELNQDVITLWVNTRRTLAE